jgi:hypothetical protein
MKKRLSSITLSLIAMIFLSSKGSILLANDCPLEEGTLSSERTEKDPNNKKLKQNQHHPQHHRLNYWKL